MAFVKKALELVSPHLCVRECVLADLITEPALKQYLEMGIITSHYILILFFFLQILDLVQSMCQTTEVLCIPSHWSATFTPLRGEIQTSLMLLLYEEFLSPASWLKVALFYSNVLR